MSTFTNPYPTNRESEGSEMSEMVERVARALGMPPRSTHRGYVTKDIMQRLFPDGAPRPDGLLTAIFVALGEAERRGFEDCMSIFEKPQGANENLPTGTNHPD